MWREGERRGRVVREGRGGEGWGREGWGREGWGGEGLRILTYTYALSIPTFYFMAPRYLPCRWDFNRIL